jgi:hypothetical protein
MNYFQFPPPTHGNVTMANVCRDNGIIFRNAVFWDSLGSDDGKERGGYLYRERQLALRSLIYPLCDDTLQSLSSSPGILTFSFLYALPTGTLADKSCQGINFPSQFSVQNTCEFWAPGISRASHRQQQPMSLDRYPRTWKTSASTVNLVTRATVSFKL